mmetsp:Transcript_15567/g.31961  ORF Transcript_15567/g.31961 Transcript_15567/m.31961 type:complete len:138 (-) Transcript_15567:234-647(-)
MAASASVTTSKCESIGPLERSLAPMSPQEAVTGWCKSGMRVLHSPSGRVGVVQGLKCSWVKVVFDEVATAAVAKYPPPMALDPSSVRISDLKPCCDESVAAVASLRDAMIYASTISAQKRRACRITEDVSCDEKSEA